MMMRKQLLIMLTALLALTQGAWATGELTGLFSVSATKKVQFSQGNLQATTSDLGANWTWAFATNQYDYVGNAAANNAINGNGSVSENGTVDLFGWSTSATYYGINICNDNAGDYSGDFRDWGNLAISNGGNTAYSGWRTLTKDEWAYLFANHTYGYATVADVKGIIIVPDGYAGSAINSDHSNDTNPFARNTIDASTWTSTYVPKGVVFLPAAGFRLSWFGQVQENAYYWTSTPVDATNKYATLLGKPSNGAIITYSSGGNWPACDGFSVRLVKDVPTASFATGSGGDGWSISPTTAVEGSTVTVSYSGVHKVKSVIVAKKLPGKFSVSSTKQVRFSPGNLQYVGTWQFASNQYDYIGHSQADNNRDLFGWGTKTNPNNTSTTDGDYSWAEWGENTITNGGTGWRTLTKDEWVYLFTERTNADNLRTFATVNGKAGVILMPDGWTASSVTLTITMTNFTTNDLSTSQWDMLEKQGCVFLPAAGYRSGTTMYGVGMYCYYWSSTPHESSAILAYDVDCNSDYVSSSNADCRRNGFSVRLVKNVE